MRGHPADRSPEERLRLRTSFDRVARLYDRARPGYPEELFDGLAALSGVPPGGRVLEIASGTGHATVPLARRGYRVLGVELGESLASVAREKLGGFPQAEVRTGLFEDEPLEEGSFDLAVCASAFHWFDPDEVYPRISRALRPGGALALFWNASDWESTTEGFPEALREVYEREAPEVAWSVTWTRQDDPDTAAGMRATGLFGEVATREYRWSVRYTAAGYSGLLGTYSGHIDLPENRRVRLLRGVEDLIDTSFGGNITQGYRAT